VTLRKIDEIKTREPLESSVDTDAKCDADGDAKCDVDIVADAVAAVAKSVSSSSSWRQCFKTFSLHHKRSGKNKLERLSLESFYRVA
jgi:hypothetical protein